MAFILFHVIFLFWLKNLHIQKRSVHFAYICSYILQGEVYRLTRMKKVQNHVKFFLIFAFVIVLSSCPF